MLRPKLRSATPTSATPETKIWHQQPCINHPKEQKKGLVRDLLRALLHQGWFQCFLEPEYGQATPPEHLKRN
jgi:hypothetical protein